MLRLALTSAPMILWAFGSGSRHGRARSDECWSEMQASVAHMHAALHAATRTGDSNRDFVRLMLPHHQAALAMAETQLRCGTDPALRRLAHEIIVDQQSEIDLMTLWLTDSTRRSEIP